MKGLLRIDQRSMSVENKLHINLKKEFFVNEDSEWKKLILAPIAAAEESPNRRAAGVLVTSHYSIMMGATSERQIYVIDSHSHSPHYGALVAVSGSSSVDAITRYL